MPGPITWLPSIFLVNTVEIYEPESQRAWALNPAIALVCHVSDCLPRTISFLRDIKSADYLYGSANFKCCFDD